MRLSEGELQEMVLQFDESGTIGLMARELLAARRVVEAARAREGTSPHSDRWDDLPAALAAYDEATR